MTVDSSDNGPSRPRLSRKKRFAFVLVFLILCLLATEVAIRALDIDSRMVATILVYQDSNAVAYETARDPFLRYESRPGVWTLAPDQGDEVEWTVTINEHRARGPAYDVNKAEGTFRILFYGGSTAYGHGVADDRTMPARLERALAETLPERRVEVWNFARQGYMVSQSSRLARDGLQRLDPDLIVMHLHNQGRRLHMWTEDPTQTDVDAFAADEPHFYAENIPAGGVVPAGLHRALLRWSAIYRTLAAAAFRNETDPEWAAFVGGYGDQVSCEELAILEGEAQAVGVPVVLFNEPARHPGGASRDAPLCVADVIPEDRLVRWAAVDREDDFYETHPPSRVLDEHARYLARQLLDGGFLP